MKAEQIYEVIKKLIGPIDPVADSAIDEKRGENMDTMTSLILLLHQDVEYVARHHKDSPYASQKAVADQANKYLDSLGINN